MIMMMMMMMMPHLVRPAQAQLVEVLTTQAPRLQEATH
jgi:hypothetical protein